METKINILFDEETKKDLAIGMRNKLVHQSVDSELKEQTIAKLNNLKEIPFERLIPTLEEMYAEEFTEEKKALFIGIYGLPINCIEMIASVAITYKQYRLCGQILFLRDNKEWHSNK